MSLLSDNATLKANRQATADLIAYQGRDTVLIRPAAPVADGAGGFANNTAPPTTGSSTRRFLSRVRSNEVDLGGPEGERYVEHFVLIGLYTDDIAEGDYMMMNGYTWHISTVDEDRSYQIKGEGRVTINGGT